MTNVPAPDDQSGTWALGEGIIKGDVWISGPMIVQMSEERAMYLRSIIEDDEQPPTASL